jgi:hypothetical protein
MRCVFCGQEYVPGHYGKCVVVEKALGDADVQGDGIHEEIEDITELVMNGGPGKGHYTKCKVVDGKRICKVKGCNDEAMPKRGCCRAHQLERYRANSAKLQLEKVEKRSHHAR